MISFINTDFSLCSTFKPEDMKNQCILCDNNLGGVVEYFKACKEKNFKPVIGYRGNEIYIARDKAEYQELLIAYSESRTPKILQIVGAPFCELANLVTESYFPYVPAEDAWEKAKEYVRNLDGVVIGITPYSGDCYEALRELLRDLAAHLSLPTCLVDDVHYSSNTALSDGVQYEPPKDHQILVCHRTKKSVNQSSEMEDRYRRFFLSNDFYPQDWSSFPEYKGTQNLVDICEEYEILSEPTLPHFENATEVLTNLAREGWKQKKISDKPNWKVYRDRIKEEIKIIDKSGFASYFLILEDVCRWIDENGWLRGFGRGSAGGCLISYLTNITRVDPIIYSLSMDRFYSQDRAEARQLPDIDIDVPKFKRKEVFAYLQNKYGHNSVAQMVTFSELQGRSALTSVLKNNDSCGFSEIKTITELLPMKDKVADQMETSGEDSLIRWTLEYLPERLSNYARLENEKIVGDYADDFYQAIRLEGVKVDTGKHASAIIVYGGEIKTVCPMMGDKSSEEKITALSMSDGEAVGLVKLDLLGLQQLDTLMLANELIEEKNKAKNDEIH
jgi:DNA polymerase III alpha subunit